MKNNTYSKSNIRQAVLLAAGRGSRLDPFTAELPKCLVRVGEQSILVRLLEELESFGIEKVILVHGYKGDLIMEAIGPLWKSMNIEYVENNAWSQSNNMYSLFLASPHIDGDFLLCESDILLEPGGLKGLEQANKAAVSPFTVGMSGSSLLTDQNGKVVSMKVSSNHDHSPDLPFKTVNIYSLDYNSYRSSILPIMKTQVQEGDLNVFYELAIAKAIDKNRLCLQAIDFSQRQWIEVDSPDDLEKARLMFEIAKKEVV